MSQANQVYVVANWKSNKNRTAVESWWNEFSELVEQRSLPSSAVVVIAPPFPSLMFVSNQLLDTQLYAGASLGVQDVSSLPAGSYTGAVSTENLAGFNVGYAIVGHSERRRYFHETHQDVAQKVDHCLGAGITPIVCVDDEYIDQQAAAIEKSALGRCLVAYEELGAIGTGHSEPVEHVKIVVAHIKAVFGDVPVLYGGSVKASNASVYSRCCQGVLVGGASLQPTEFAAIIHQVSGSHGSP